LLAASLAAGLAGCATVGPNFKPPAPPIAQTYTQVGDSAPSSGVQAMVGEQVAAEWWTLFRSPALDAVVREALANNKTIEQARARLAAAQEDVTAQTGLLNLDANAGYQRERANLYAFSGGAFKPGQGGLSFPTNPEFNLYTIGGAVSYNFDLFGQVRRRKEALQADVESRARELDAAYLTLTGQVVVQALRIADADIQVAALRDIVANDQSDLDMVRGAQAAGGASRVDVAAIESELEQDAAAIPVQQQRLVEARHQLAVLVGKAPSEWSPPEFDASSGSLPAALPVAVPSALVRGRPDILEAEAQLHAATARIGVAEAALYPNITLSASLTQNAIAPEQMFQAISNSWAIGPSLSVPLFHSGELRAQKREAEAEARAALATYQQTVLNAFGQVADALQAIVHDNEAYDAQTRALAAASGRLDMLRRGYRVGGVAALELVDAERDWRRTRLALAEQGTGRYTDAARLLLATASVPPVTPAP
jgi:NodT family efflux transporter outer membrane factor (OMF) lipoprotein